jgi:hypothetical protein
MSVEFIDVRLPNGVDQIIIGAGWALIGQIRINVEKRKYDVNEASYERGS